MSDFVWKNSKGKDRAPTGRGKIDSGERSGSCSRRQGLSVYREGKYLCPKCGHRKFFIKRGMFECTRCRHRFEKKDLK